MSGTTAKKNLLNTIIDGISDIFLPLVNLLSAVGILKGVLAVLTTASVVAADSETYLLLNAVANSLFYFLPVFLAYTAAKRFGANPFTCMVIAGILLYPSLTVPMEQGVTLHLFGLPVKAVTYHSGVLPIIMAAGLLTFTERFLNKVIPDLIKGFTVPMLSIVFVGFVTLFVFGPIGAVIGDGLAAGYSFLYKLSPVIAGALLAALIQPMVIFGFHWGMLLVSMNNVALTGHDTVLTLISPAIYAQIGATIAVMLKSRDKAFRSLCVSAAISAAFGVTEPAMFSINLPRKKPMAAVCIGGAAGGALAGFSGAQASAFALPSIVSIPIFLGDGFLLYLLSCLTGLIVAFAVTMLIHKEEPAET